MEAIVPAGQDELLARILAQGETLAGDCRLVRGGAEGGVIRAWYQCTDAEVSVELHHPEAISDASIVSERFAVISRGVSPAGFLPALLAHLREHEKRFEWRILDEQTDRRWQELVRLNAWLFLVLGLLSLLAMLLRVVLDSGVASLWLGLFGARCDLAMLAVFTLLGAWLRFFVAVPNLFDHGGVPYMRLLRGANGYWGTAQLYAPFYALTNADLEHAILLNRLVGVLTIPIAYSMCRSLQPRARLWALLSALLFAVHPLHVLFTASDALAVPSVFLAAVGYAFLGNAVRQATVRSTGSAAHALSCLYFVTAALALCLLTQVRQEHVIFLLPAVAFVTVYRRQLPLWALAPGLLLALVLLSFYVHAVVTAGVRYQPVWPSLQVWCEEAFRNPVLALPALIFGSIAVGMYGSLQSALLALLVWIPAIVFPASIGLGGHHATRVYANWLIWILPSAAYGFSLLLRSPRRIVRLLGAAALSGMVLHPVVVRDVFSTPYLEILEHQSFRDLLNALPESVRYIVVADDDLEGIDSTLEAFNKYARILDASSAGRRGVRLRKLSEQLALPPGSTCGKGESVFFYGLPCQIDGLTSPAGKACAGFLERNPHTVWSEDSLIGGSFLHCSIYSGAAREHRCAPSFDRYRFAAYLSAGPRPQPNSDLNSL